MDSVSCNKPTIAVESGSNLGASSIRVGWIGMFSEELDVACSVVMLVLMSKSVVAVLVIQRLDVWIWGTKKFT